MKMSKPRFSIIHCGYVPFSRSQGVNISSSLLFVKYYQEHDAYNHWKCKMEFFIVLLDEIKFYNLKYLHFTFMLRLNQRTMILICIMFTEFAISVIRFLLLFFLFLLLSSREFQTQSSLNIMKENK